MKNNGITLIALIITIIVLLILSAVVINLTIGENGLFSTAKYAARQYKMAETKDKISLAITDIQAEYIANDKEFTMDAIASELPNKVKDLSIQKDGEEAKGTCDNFKYKIDKDYNIIIEGLDESTGGNTGGSEDGEEEIPNPNEDPYAKYWEFEYDENNDCYDIIGINSKYLNEIINAVELRLPNTYKGKQVQKMSLKNYGNGDGTGAESWKTKTLYISSKYMLQNRLNLTKWMPELTDYKKDEERWKDIYASEYNLENGYIIRKSPTTGKFDSFVSFPRGRTGSFVVPTDITSIEASCFRNSMLNKIELPEGLIVCWTYAFKDCPNLTSLTFPETFERDDTGMIDGCEKLASVYFKRTTWSTKFNMGKGFVKTTGAVTTFYFKNENMRTQFSYMYNDNEHGTLSTNYNW